MACLSLSGALFYASFLFYTLTPAFVIFPESSLQDSGYSDGCVDALSTNITQCSKAVSVFDANTVYTQTVLESSCTNECQSALQSWEESIKDSCSDVTYKDDYGKMVPISAIATERIFNYNQTCRMDDGEYCNLVLGNLTTASGNRSTGDKGCNKCALFKLRDTASFQYGDGPLVFSKGIYQSYTSSCHFTGYPFSTTPTLLPTMSSPAASSTSGAAHATPTSACKGTRYHIESGDTCNSIASSQGVATWQLLMDNNLPAYCAKFPKAGTLCIRNQCDVYTVKEGDTCHSVSAAHKISTVQLRAYNPWIDAGCYNFNRTIGTQICVSEPGGKYIPPSRTTSAAGSGAPSAAPVPSNVAANTTTRCGQYYETAAGEECDVFTRKFGISREDFGILNPGVNANCTNLLSRTSYCVQPVGDINTYPNAPGYIGPTSSVSKIAYTSLPDATYSPIFDVTPLAPHTRQDCSMYAAGSDLQYEAYKKVSQCQSASYFYGVSVDDLILWNPSLRKGSSSSRSKRSNISSSSSSSSSKPTNSANACSFSKHFRYCVASSDASSPSSSPMASTSRAPSSTPPSLPLAFATIN